MTDTINLENIKKLVTAEHLKKAVVVCGAIGIGLIFLSALGDMGLFSKSERSDEFSVTTYSTQIAHDLETVISKIEGAGKTKVLLTMENSVEYVYLDDSATKTKEVQPIIRGVLVVCQGGGDPVVEERITNAVTKALDISTAKVCVSKLSE